MQVIQHYPKGGETPEAGAPALESVEILDDSCRAEIQALKNTRVYRIGR